jgi:PAS domain S-box-containing protein
MTDSSADADPSSAARLADVLATMPNAFVSVDAAFGITYLNPAAEKMLGAPRADLLGRCVWESVGEPAGSEFETQLRAAWRDRRSVVFEQFYRPRGSWFEVDAWPDPHGLNISFVNIDERQRTERRRTEALNDATSANARLSFLTDVASALSGAPTRLAVFERLARVVVPAMADWCTVVEPSGDALVRVVAMHREAALDALAQRLVGTYPHSFSGPSPGVVAYFNRQSLRLERLAGEIVADLDDSVASAAYGRTLLLLGDGPGLITPIFFDGEVTAVLTMVRVEGQPFSDGDVATLVEAATQVSAALEGARHIDSERQTAAALQAAALPKALPAGEGLRLAAGYRAASEGAQVGGDWYDAIELDDGRLTLVVGDAAGHGLEAAALMAQMRNVLRAHLFAGLGPAESLAQLCGLLAVQEPDAFATIICVEIEPGRGSMVWTSAGHPGPILVRADGTSVHLAGEAAPPIGWSFLLPPVAPPEHRLMLEPGDRLLLFTDGLVERRGIDLDIGIANLMFVAEMTYPEVDLQVACDTVLRDMLPGSHEDDACLLLADYVFR